MTYCLPSCVGSMFPQSGANYVNSDESTAVTVQCGSMGFVRMTNFIEFSDFIYTIPLPHEIRSGKRDVDFGFRSADRDFVQVDGQLFLTDNAPDLPRHQDRSYFLGETGVP